MTRLIGASAPYDSQAGTMDIGEQGEGGTGLSAVQLLMILRAYWKHVAIIFFTITLLGAGFIKMLPKSYTATATLKVNYELSDPLAGQSANGPIQAGGYIPTEIQMMQSTNILLRVVDQLQLTQDKAYAAGYAGDPGNLRQWIAERLMKDLDIEQGYQGAYLINVTATARTPARAAQIANAVVDNYVDQERLRIADPAADRARRYAEQLAELKAKVSAAEDQVAQFRQRTGITDPANQKNVEADTFNSLETRLEAAKITRHEAEVKAMADPALVSDSTAANARLQNLRNSLATLETQMAQLRATLGASHPKVLELQAQITAVHQSMAAELRMYRQEATADLAAAQQLEQSLQRAIDQQRTKVLAAAQLQDEGNKYMLELESAQSVYKRALDGYDQIMFAWQGHYTYVDIISRAEVPLRSTKPNKMKLLMALLVAAAAAATAGPLGYELFLHRRIRCRDDIERGFGVPVLIELSPMLDRANAAA